MRKQRSRDIISGRGCEKFSHAHKRTHCLYPAPPSMKSWLRPCTSTQCHSKNFSYMYTCFCHPSLVNQALPCSPLWVLQLLPGADPGGGGGSWGSDDPPFSWKKNYVISTTDTTSLAKLSNLFLSVTSCHKKHGKLTSNAVNLSKSGAMLAKKTADRAILPRARRRLGAWSKILRARFARGYAHAPPF